jgi:hypothetical protein
MSLSYRNPDILLNNSARAAAADWGGHSPVLPTGFVGVAGIAVGGGDDDDVAAGAVGGVAAALGWVADPDDEETASPDDDDDGADVVGITVAREGSGVGAGGRPFIISINAAAVNTGGGTFDGVGFTGLVCQLQSQ